MNHPITIYRVFFLAKILVTFFLRLNNVIAQQEQFASLYNSTNCGGNPISNMTTEVTYLITDYLPGVSYRVEGLWTIELCRENYLTCYLREVRSGKLDENCYQLIPERENYTRFLFTRFGDVNQVKTELTFFSEPEFKGERFLVDERGREYKEPIEAQSYFFTGQNVWEILKVRNETEGTCLNDTLGGSEYGFTVNPRTRMQVGAVRFECRERIRSTTGRPSSGNRLGLSETIFGLLLAVSCASVKFR